MNKYVFLGQGENEREARLIIIHNNGAIESHDLLSNAAISGHDGWLAAGYESISIDRLGYELGAATARHQKYLAEMAVKEAKPQSNSASHHLGVK